MNNNLSKFLANAKSIQLSAQERSDCKSALFREADATYIEPMASTAQAVSLSAEELDAGKQALFNYMGKRPLITSSLFDLESFFQSFFSMRLLSGLMGVVLLVTTTGGVSYAAEGSVPGDLLYSVKVDFTEPLLERFQWSSKKKAHYCKRRMERRMEEMEALLESGGPIPTDVLANIAERMEEHSKRMEEHLASISSDNEADEMRTKLEERLTKHEQILAEVKNGTIDPQELLNFKKNIEKQRGKMHDGMRHDHYELRQQIKQNPELREQMKERREEFRKNSPDSSLLPHGMLFPKEGRMKLHNRRMPVFL